MTQRLPSFTATMGGRRACPRARRLMADLIARQPVPGPMYESPSRLQTTVPGDDCFGWFLHDNHFCGLATADMECYFISQVNAFSVFISPFLPHFHSSFSVRRFSKHCSSNSFAFAPRIWYEYSTGSHASHSLSDCPGRPAEGVGSVGSVQPSRGEISGLQKLPNMGQVALLPETNLSRVPFYAATLMQIKWASIREMSSVTS